MKNKDKHLVTENTIAELKANNYPFDDDSIPNVYDVIDWIYDTYGFFITTIIEKQIEKPVNKPPFIWHVEDMRHHRNDIVKPTGTCFETATDALNDAICKLMKHIRFFDITEKLVIEKGNGDIKLGSVNFHIQIYVEDEHYVYGDELTTIEMSDIFRTSSIMMKHFNMDRHYLENVVIHFSGIYDRNKKLTELDIDTIKGRHSNNHVFLDLDNLIYMKNGREFQCMVFVYRDKFEDE